MFPVLLESNLDYPTLAPILAITKRSPDGVFVSFEVAQEYGDSVSWLGVEYKSDTGLKTCRDFNNVAEGPLPPSFRASCDGRNKATVTVFAHGDEFVGAPAYQASTECYLPSRQNLLVSTYEVPCVELCEPLSAETTEPVLLGIVTDEPTLPPTPFPSLNEEFTDSPSDQPTDEPSDAPTPCIPETDVIVGYEGFGSFLPDTEYIRILQQSPDGQSVSFSVSQEWKFVGLDWIGVQYNADTGTVCYDEVDVDSGPLKPVFEAKCVAGYAKVKVMISDECILPPPDLGFVAPEEIDEVYGLGLLDEFEELPDSPHDRPASGTSDDSDDEDQDEDEEDVDEDDEEEEYEGIQALTASGKSISWLSEKSKMSLKSRKASAKSNPSGGSGDTSDDVDDECDCDCPCLDDDLQRTSGKVQSSGSNGSKSSKSSKSGSSGSSKGSSKGSSGSSKGSSKGSGSKSSSKSDDGEKSNSGSGSGSSSDSVDGIDSGRRSRRFLFSPRDLLGSSKGTSDSQSGSRSDRSQSGSSKSQSGSSKSQSVSGSGSSKSKSSSSSPSDDGVVAASTMEKRQGPHCQCHCPCSSGSGKSVKSVKSKTTATTSEKSVKSQSSSSKSRSKKSPSSKSNSSSSSKGSNRSSKSNSFKSKSSKTSSGSNDDSSRSSKSGNPKKTKGSAANTTIKREEYEPAKLLSVEGETKCEDSPIETIKATGDKVTFKVKQVWKKHESLGRIVTVYPTGPAAVECAQGKDVKSGYQNVYTAYCTDDEAEIKVYAADDSFSSQHDRCGTPSYCNLADLEKQVGYTYTVSCKSTKRGEVSPKNAVDKYSSGKGDEYEAKAKKAKKSGFNGRFLTAASTGSTGECVADGSTLMAELYLPCSPGCDFVEPLSLPLPTDSPTLSPTASPTASPTSPSCTDGRQNGQETGVDCGGPDCPPCPSCTDGEKNGFETGVDCGGPDCPPCPSCSDGEQNGEETGVDCGGPDCPACPTDSPTESPTPCVPEYDIDVVQEWFGEFEPVGDYIHLLQQTDDGEYVKFQVSQEWKLVSLDWIGTEYNTDTGPVCYTEDNVDYGTLDKVFTAKCVEGYAEVKVLASDECILPPESDEFRPIEELEPAYVQPLGFDDEEEEEDIDYEARGYSVEEAEEDCDCDCPCLEETSARLQSSGSNDDSQKSKRYNGSKGSSKGSSKSVGSSKSNSNSHRSGSSSNSQDGSSSNSSKSRRFLSWVSSRYLNQKSHGSTGSSDSASGSQKSSKSQSRSVKSSKSASSSKSKGGVSVKQAKKHCQCECPCMGDTRAIGSSVSALSKNSKQSVKSSKSTGSKSSKRSSKSSKTSGSKSSKSSIKSSKTSGSKSSKGTTGSRSASASDSGSNDEPTLKKKKEKSKKQYQVPEREVFEEAKLLSTDGTTKCEENPIEVIKATGDKVSFTLKQVWKKEEVERVLTVFPTGPATVECAQGQRVKGGYGNIYNAYCTNGEAEIKIFIADQSLSSQDRCGTPSYCNLVDFDKQVGYTYKVSCESSHSKVQPSSGIKVDTLSYKSKHRNLSVGSNSRRALTTASESAGACLADGSTIVALVRIPCSPGCSAEPISLPIPDPVDNIVEPLGIPDPVDNVVEPLGIPSPTTPESSGTQVSAASVRSRKGPVSNPSVDSVDDEDDCDCDCPCLDEAVQRTSAQVQGSPESSKGSGSKSSNSSKGSGSKSSNSSKGSGSKTSNSSKGSSKNSSSSNGSNESSNSSKGSIKSRFLQSHGSSDGSSNSGSSKSSKSGSSKSGSSKSSKSGSSKSGSSKSVSGSSDDGVVTSATSSRCQCHCPCMSSGASTTSLKSSKSQSSKSIKSKSIKSKSVKKSSSKSSKGPSGSSKSSKSKSSKSSKGASGSSKSSKSTSIPSSKSTKGSSVTDDAAVEPLGVPTPPGSPVNPAPSPPSPPATPDVIPRAICEETYLCSPEAPMEGLAVMGNHKESLTAKGDTVEPFWSDGTTVKFHGHQYWLEKDLSWVCFAWTDTNNQYVAKKFEGMSDKDCDEKTFEAMCDPKTNKATIEVFAHDGQFDKACSVPYPKACAGVVQDGTVGYKFEVDCGVYGQDDGSDKVETGSSATVMAKGSGTTPPPPPPPPSPTVSTLSVPSSTPPQKETTCPVVEMNFNGVGLSKGMYITDQLKSQWGITIQASAPTNGYTPNGAARVFDTADPGTTNDTGDPDLGSPNRDCPGGGGPGVGPGGHPNSPFANCVPQGYVLIVQERNQKSVMNKYPDDNAKGGTIEFSFDNPVDLDTVYILDIDETKPVELDVELADGTRPPTVYSPPNYYGDNGLFPLGVNERDVVKLKVTFPGSGAIAQLDYRPTECPPP